MAGQGFDEFYILAGRAVFVTVGSKVRLLVVVRVDFRHAIGLCAFVPLRVLEFRRALQFLPVRIQMQDFLGDIVMQGARRHGGQCITNADESAGGQDHLDDPAGFHIQREVIHFAEFFILVVFDFHADEVAGFGRAVQPVRPLRMGSAFAGVAQTVRFWDGGVLRQRRERQDRAGGGADEDLQFPFHISVRVWFLFAWVVHGKHFAFSCCHPKRGM